MNIWKENLSYTLSETLKGSVSHLALTDYFKSMVNYNLYTLSGSWYEYISSALKKLLLLPWQLGDYNDIFLTIPKHIVNLNIFECKKLIREIDILINSPLYLYTQEEQRSFFHIRSYVFTRYQRLQKDISIKPPPTYYWEQSLF